MKLTIADNPDALFWATFNRFELRIPGQAVLDIAQPGPADSAVDYWAGRINRYAWGEDHAWAPTPARVREELREYGAWDDDDLLDDDENWHRIVWMAACNIAEDEEPDCGEPATIPLDPNPQPA